MRSLPATLETTFTNADLTNLLRNHLAAEYGEDHRPGNRHRLKRPGHWSTTMVTFHSPACKARQIFPSSLSGLKTCSSPQLHLSWCASRRPKCSLKKLSSPVPGRISFWAECWPLLKVADRRFTADGQLNLRVLNGLSPDVFTSGIADVAVRVTGSYGNPRLNGTASVNSGSVSHSPR